MNKFKIILATTAALTTIGGAFALKAKKLGSKVLYVSYLDPENPPPITPAGQQYCTVTCQNVGTAYEVRPTGILSSFLYFYVTETAPLGTGADLCTYKYYTFNH
jgi:hypothetical protein